MVREVRVLALSTCFGSHTWRCPEVSSKTPGFAATRRARSPSFWSKIPVSCRHKRCCKLSWGFFKKIGTSVTLRDVEAQSWTEVTGLAAVWPVTQTPSPPPPDIKVMSWTCNVNVICWYFFINFIGPVTSFVRSECSSAEQTLTTLTVPEAKYQQINAQGAKKITYLLRPQLKQQQYIQTGPHSRE